MTTTIDTATVDASPIDGVGPWQRVDRVAITARASSILSATPRPFIRWVGSKQRLLSQLVEHLPSGYHRYYEPFFGAGSMYFVLQPQEARLSDYCGPLINMYQTVREDPAAVIRALSGMNVLDKDFFYEVRRHEPKQPVDRAARFIYLNRAAWNGLYRVNANGQFNVPYGSPRSPIILDEENFLSAAKQLAGPNVRLATGDFEDAVADAGEGDLVFLDPPYATSKRRESFVDYNEKLFTWGDQVRLAACAEHLRSRGARVIVTNAFNSAIRALYPKFTEHALVRRSSLAADVTLRGSVAESVFVS